MNFSCSYSQKVVANQILANLESSSGMRIAVLCTVTLNNAEPKRFLYQNVLDTHFEKTHFKIATEKAPKTIQTPVNTTKPAKQDLVRKHSKRHD